MKKSLSILIAIIVIGAIACKTTSTTTGFADPKKIFPINTNGKDTLVTPSGLKYILIEAGSGAKAGYSRKVSVHYTGYFLDGKIFDSSVERGEPIAFQLGMGQVIKGWDEGIALLKVGGIARLIIPPMLGYGLKDKGPIPGNSTLIFDVMLMKVEE
ncbi:MAG: FKBP-type peptidyl-prolyl cis-trans isomerase [Bacteroidota bacterium]